MCSYKNVFIFTEISTQSALVFWETYDFLKRVFLEIKVILISKESELLKICQNVCLNLNNCLLIFILKQNGIDLRKKFSEKFFPIKSYRITIVSNEKNSRKKNSKIIKKLGIPSFKNNNKSLHFEVIEISGYFKNYDNNTLNYLEEGVITEIDCNKFRENTWIKSIILWHLRLEEKISFSRCCLKLKKISKQFIKKKFKQDSKHGKLVFSKELPMYFLYHSIIIDSFLNTPSILINFELWKNSGFSRILQFLWKISLSKKDIEKYWLDLSKEKQKKILKCFELESNTSNLTYGLIYFFKRFFKHKKEITEASSLDLALNLKTIFDLKLKKISKRVSGKNFWLALNSLFETKELKKYIRKSIKIQKFISRIGRIILSKKMFISRKNTRIIYLTSSSTISFLMIEGLTNFMIQVFNRNRLIPKFLYIIIKEKTTALLFMSHQHKSISLFYSNFLQKNRIFKEIQLIKNKNDLVVIKFPKNLEKEVLLYLTKLEL